MHFHFIYDEEQYNFLLTPLIDESRLRRHFVSTALRFVGRYDADAYISVQDAGLCACPSPRIFVPHALGLAKWVSYNLPADLIILPSEALWHAVRDTVRAGTEVAYGVGSPKIDLLLRHAEARDSIRQRVREVYGFDERPIIGYCPTFRHKGTLPHPQRNHRLREAEAALEGRYNVIVLHHSLETDKSEVEELRFRPNQSLSRIDHLVALDCVVTDTSGIGFELCAIDTPAVLLDNPSDPDFLLARMLPDRPRLDYGPVCDLNTVQEAVASALAYPNAFSAQRKHWADLAFGPRDGQAAQRIIDAITDFLWRNGKRFSERRRAPELLIDYVRRGFPKFRRSGEWKLHENFAEVALDSKVRHLFYGPYQRLGKGRFVLEVDIQASAEGEFMLGIDTDQGSNSLVRLGFERGLTAQVPFEVPGPLAGKPFEFRVIQPPNASGTACIRAFRLYVTGPAS